MSMTEGQINMIQSHTGSEVLRVSKVRQTTGADRRSMLRVVKRVMKFEV